MVAVLDRDGPLKLSFKEGLPAYLWGARVTDGLQLSFLQGLPQLQGATLPKGTDCGTMGCVYSRAPMWLAEGKLDLHQSSTSSSTNPAPFHKG